VSLVQLDDPNEFLERAAPLLLADEARHNLILGIAGTLRDQPGRYPSHELWLVEVRGVVRTAALRTPPYRLVLAGAAVQPLADRLDGLPGVVAAAPEAEAFASAWTARTGASVRRSVGQGIYGLERVTPPATAPGRPRAAGEADRELLLTWLRAFSAEALGENTDDDPLHRMIDMRVTDDPDWGFVLWEDDGVPVSLTGYGSPTPTGIRIGPVYTPPELRGRGYASALAAHVSQTQLDTGRRFCFLYTDLANPTSNKIYVDIGYERVCNSLQLDFG
jgi:uncharacterized protein